MSLRKTLTALTITAIAPFAWADLIRTCHIDKDLTLNESTIILCNDRSQTFTFADNVKIVTHGHQLIINADLGDVKIPEGGVDFISFEESYKGQPAKDCGEVQINARNAYGGQPRFKLRGHVNGAGCNVILKVKFPSFQEPQFDLAGEGQGRSGSVVLLTNRGEVSLADLVRK